MYHNVDRLIMQISLVINKHVCCLLSGFPAGLLSPSPRSKIPEDGIGWRSDEAAEGAKNWGLLHKKRPSSLLRIINVYFHHLT